MNLLLRRAVAGSWIVMSLAAFAAATHADDWPQFLGPNRDGISAEKGLARTWPAAGPKVLWTAKLGAGYGGAAVKAGKVYILDRVNDVRDVLRCLDLTSGKEQWTYSYDAPGKLDFNGSRTTPAVDDRYVFTSGPFGHFHCIDLQKQKPAWTAHLGKDFDGVMAIWGYAQNPLLYKDMVIVAPQGRKAGIAAFERATGRVVWKSAYVEGMMTGTWNGSYVSPFVATIEGVDQVIMVTAQGPAKENGQTVKGQVIGVSATDGSALWSYTGWQCDISIPCPAYLGQGRIFVNGDYDAGSHAIRIGKGSGGFTVSQIFKTMTTGSLVQRALVYNDHIYLSSNGKEAGEGLMCLDLGGNVKWHTTNSKHASKAVAGLPNFDNGNLILADGMMYIIDGKTGNLRLVDPNPGAYKELACVKGILGGEMIWAPMAISDGKLLIRDQTRMMCLDVRNP